MAPTSVILLEDYVPPRSKSALRRAVADDPRGVLIEDPQTLGLGLARTADELTEGEIVVVAGPHLSDPSFTAEITRTFGRVVVR